MQKKQKSLHTMIAISYLGGAYNGSEIQTNQANVSTVEGAVVEALRKAELVSEEGWQHIRLGRVSRTDRGVSAACAILTFDCFLQNNDVPAMLN